MNYTIEVRRVQMMERWVRATDEDAARAMIDEIERVRAGNRIFLSQDPINTFIRTHSRAGDRHTDA